MCKRSESLRAAVKERLAAAAEEIFALVERTIAEYEEEVRRCRQENQKSREEHQRSRDVLEVLLQRHDDPAQLLGQEGSDFSHTSEAEGPKPELRLPVVKSECGDSDDTDDSEGWTSAAGPSRAEAAPQEDAAAEYAQEVHQCCICDRAFPEPSALKAHMEVHLELQEDGLSERSGDGTRANAHVLIHSQTLANTRLQHKTLPKTRKLSQPRPQPYAHRSMPFCCAFCKRAFARKSDLQHHTLIHTGEKPFTCSLCDRSFNRKSNLYRHYRNHKNDP